MNYPKIPMEKVLKISDDSVSPWDGQKRPLYRVPLELLHYNIDNGRIATWVSGYRAKSNGVALEDMSVEKLNQTVGTFIKNSSSKATYDKTYNDIKAKGQIVMGAVLDDGTVVSGNRRFTVLRELLAETGDHNKYGYFLCNIFPVPNNIEERKEIKRLETATQFNEDHPVDYGPIDKLVDVYTNVMVPDAPYSDENYRVFLNLKAGEMKQLMARAQVMIEYLEYIGEPNNYDIARANKLDGPIKELADLARKVGTETWNEIKPVFFKALSLQGKGDKTRDIRRLVKSYYANPDGFVKLSSASDEEDLAADAASLGMSYAPKKEAKDDEGDFVRKMQSYVATTANSNARRKPIDKLEASYQDLLEVDCDAVAMMNPDEIKEIKDKIARIEYQINTISKAAGK
jgi:hypothetical protein